MGVRKKETEDGKSVFEGGKVGSFIMDCMDRLLLEHLHTQAQGSVSLESEYFRGKLTFIDFSYTVQEERWLLCDSLPRSVGLYTGTY